MATHKENGIIEKTVLKKTYEEIHIEWRIPEFSTVAETKFPCISYESPIFSINDISCFFRLYPVSVRNNEFMMLFLNNTMKQEYCSEYNVSLRNLNGSMEHLTTGILKKDCSTWCDMGDIIKMSEILQRKSELAPQNILTIICRLKHEINHSNEPLDKTKPLKLIGLNTLSENFKNLSIDKETCDVTLKVKNKEYKAHKTVLIARSSVFAATFKYDTLERQTGVITITDCDPDSFAVFLDYLYCGKLEEFSVCNALHLYYTSDKYDVQELKTFCVEYLILHLTVENICEVAVLADKYEEKELLSAVQEFFNKHVRTILRSPEWDCLLTKDRRLANKLMIEMSDVKLKD